MPEGTKQEDTIPSGNLILSRKNVVLFAFAGTLAFFVIILLLRLPGRIKRGEHGQAAIQMLDAMRRPFLQIKDEETRLFQTSGAENGSRQLEIAVDSANSLLGQYKELSLYNPTLSRKVDDLSGAFNNWIVIERRLFSCIADSSPTIGGTPSSSFPACDLFPAAAGFLETMSLLGTGETPIHTDIDDGTKASHILQGSVAVLTLYLIVLVFWSHGTKLKNEAKLLQESLHAEQKAMALEKSLSKTFEKVLSGFIPICVRCKRIHGKKDEWSSVETYITNRTDAEFSHGLCPECLKRVYGKFLPPEKSKQAK